MQCQEAPLAPMYRALSDAILLALWAADLQDLEICFTTNTLFLQIKPLISNITQSISKLLLILFDTSLMTLSESDSTTSGISPNSSANLISSNIALASTNSISPKKGYLRTWSSHKFSLRISNDDSKPSETVNLIYCCSWIQCKPILVICEYWLPNGPFLCTRGVLMGWAGVYKTFGGVSKGVLFWTTKYIRWEKDQFLRS